MEKSRGHWKSRAGFVFAAAGSAIGLGNLWKFPYEAGANGGGAFVLIYFIILCIVGFTLMIAEVTMGRHTQKNALGAFKKLNKKFSFVGALGIIAGFVILSFYCVIGGWVIKYLIDSISGALANGAAMGYDKVFIQFITSTKSPIFYQAVFMILTLLIVLGGVSKGIEKASKIMMPALFVMMLILLVRSLTLPNAFEGVKFLFKPDFKTAFNYKVIISAMGQVFFSLSLGMGCMITYGSYLKKDTRIPTSAGMIVLLDTLIAILAGLVILPAVFSFGFAPSAGPGLMFITLPAIFSSMKFGGLFAVIFFLLVLFAALTSSISLLEVCVSYVVDEWKKTRGFSAILIAIVIFLLGIPSSLSQGIWADKTLFGLGFLDLMDYLSSKILLPLGGLLLCIFVGWIWKPENAIKEITNNGEIQFKTAKLWTLLIKYIVPIIILIILVTSSGLIKL